MSGTRFSASIPKTNSKVKNALKDPQIMIMKTKGGIINMLGGQRKLRLLATTSTARLYVRTAL